MHKFVGWFRQGAKKKAAGIFRLLRYFTTVSIIVFVVVTVLLAVFYSRAARDHIIELGEQKNVALTYSFANSLWPEFAPFVASSKGLSGDQLRADPRTDKLHDLVLAQMSGLTVRKVKVYNLQGLTVFSTEADQIGQDKSTNAGFLAARDGRIVSELTHKDTFSAFEGEIQNRDLLSSYIPIRHDPAQPVEGVFEVYDDVTELFQEMQRDEMKIIAGIVVILLGLYLVLFLVVRHADTLIRRQQARIQQVNAELSAARDHTLALNDQLEQKVEARTASLTLEIEERKKAEKVLEESEARYLSLVHLGGEVGEAIVMLQDENEREGLQIFCNEAWPRLTGYSCQELLNTSFFDLVHPENRETSLRRHRGQIRGENIPGLYEMTIVRKDGSEVPVELTSAYSQFLGRPTNVAYIRDITERRRAAKEIEGLLNRESQAAKEWQEIIDAVPDIIFLLSRHHDILRINRAGCKVLGKKPEELIGQKCYQVVHALYAPIRECPCLKALETRTVHTGELIEHGKHYLLGAYPIFDKSGEIAAITHTIKDVTDQKIAEERIAHLASFPKLNPSPVIEMAENGRISYANPVAMVMFPTLSVNPGQHPYLSGIEDLVRQANREQPATREIKIDGRCYLQTIQHLKDSHVVRIYGLDITERKKAESALEQTINELERFAYTAAHDLRGPLVTIQGFASILQADLKKQEMARVEEDARRIEAGIATMQTLLSKILEYGRSSRIARPTEKVPLREIIDESLKQVAGLIDLSGASISVDGEFPAVPVDRTLMTQVFNNLVRNCTDYRDKSRPLVIEIGHRLSGGEMVYFVRDNGTGISPAGLKKVFEPFYRGAKESRGAGLGLKIAKKIVEGHGGRIWLESEPGKGTSVCFTLASRKERDEQ